MSDFLYVDALVRDLLLLLLLLLALLLAACCLLLLLLLLLLVWSPEPLRAMGVTTTAVCCITPVRLFSVTAPVFGQAARRRPSRLRQQAFLYLNMVWLLRNCVECDVLVFVSCTSTSTYIREGQFWFSYRTTMNEKQQQSFLS